MHTGLILAGGGTSVRQMAEIARDAERAGLHSVYVTEAWRSAFVPLTAIALATSRIEIGPYILNAYARSVWAAAMSAIDLDEVSQGRLVLGVGSGNKHINEQWLGVPQERPLTKMAEYVTLLKQAVATRRGDTLHWQGRMHRMDWPPAIEPCRASIPVFLAALYPKMTAVAGRVADGIATGALLSPAYLRDVVRPQFEQAASAAGRDPKSLGFTVAPFVSVAADVDTARNAAREAICRLYAPLPHPYYDFVLREQGFSKAADAAARWMPEGKLDRALEAVTDDVLDAVTISGTLPQCREQLAGFEGVVDQALFVNVNYSGTSPETLLAAFRDLISLGSRH